ncbi:hypothetical protein ACYSUW_14795 [Pseudomonas frederiksbergensis]
MSNVSNLDVKPEMAAKALAADNEAKREFFEKVVEFSKTFSVKETSRLLKISVGWLRTYSAEKGITYPDPLTRSKEEQRAVNRQFEKLRPLKELRKVEPVARALPGQIQLTPELEARSRHALRRAKIAFHKRVVALAEVFSLHEAAQLLNVGVRYLTNYGYDWDIQFCGEQRTYAISAADAMSETAIEAVADTAVVADVPVTPPAAVVIDAPTNVAVVAAEVVTVVPAEVAHLVADNVVAAATPVVAASRVASKPSFADTTKTARSAASPVRTKNPFVNAVILGGDLTAAAPISAYPKNQIPIGSSNSFSNAVILDDNPVVATRISKYEKSQIPISALSHSSAEIFDDDLKTSTRLFHYPKSQIPIGSPFSHSSAEIFDDDLATASRIFMYPRNQVPIGSSYSLN